jgi:hypothetical protein
LVEVGKDATKARAAGSWSALAALHRQRQSLRAEFDAERHRIEDAKGDSGDDPRDLTPEQIREREETRSSGLEDIHLQIYMAEYLRRHPTLRLVTTDGTEIQVIRRTG